MDVVLPGLFDGFWERQTDDTEIRTLRCEAEPILLAIRRHLADLRRDLDRLSFTATQDGQACRLAALIAQIGQQRVD